MIIFVIIRIIQNFRGFHCFLRCVKISYMLHFIQVHSTHQIHNHRQMSRNTLTIYACTNLYTQMHRHIPAHMHTQTCMYLNPHPSLPTRVCSEWKGMHIYPLQEGSHFSQGTRRSWREPLSTPSWRRAGEGSDSPWSEATSQTSSCRSKAWFWMGPLLWTGRWRQVGSSTFWSKLIAPLDLTHVPDLSLSTTCLEKAVHFLLFGPLLTSHISSVKVGLMRR